jgi:sulfite reductase (NADPH) flavoprotein alpha-component
MPEREQPAVAQPDECPKAMSLPMTLPQTAPFSPDQITALNRVMAESTADQRMWLSGFLAGYNAAQSGRATAAAPVARMPLTILYATESGNAEKVAADIRKAAAKLGFAAMLLDMADAEPAAIARARNLLVVASTWGEGDPPERAAEFYGVLMGDGAPRFDGVRFGVLALGDSAYANFCETGKRIDARLEALGGTRVSPRVDCDTDFEGPATDWAKNLLSVLKDQAKDEAPALTLVRTETADAAEPMTYSRTQPFEAEIVELIDLNGTGSSKATFHLSLSVEGSGLLHEPGDALGIVPVNDPAVIDAVAGAAGLGSDDAIRRRLAEELDITTLTRPVIERYATLTGDKAVAALLTDGTLARYLDGRQVLDLLETFPHRLTADQLAGLLRPLPGRLYSIASSRRAQEDKIDLLIGAVRYESHGRRREGVTSGFVGSRSRVGDRLKVYLKPNRHFRLPGDADRPVLMIGPGTGVAPFRAFLQEREATGAKGRNWLFFGDRRFTNDFLYQLEWQDLKASGVLTRIDLAFSRDQPEKIYVQDRLWQNRADVWAWLQDGAHLYVCGDEKAMARDVHAMLRRIVADRSGRDEAASEAWLSDLKRHGRYQRDVY